MRRSRLSASARRRRLAAPIMLALMSAISFDDARSFVNFLVGVSAALAISLLATWRRVSRLESRIDTAPERRPVTRGVVICDWVDPKVLSSIAEQKGLGPDPVRLERAEESRRSRGITGGLRLFAGRAEREAKSDLRAFYELTQDPNALLVRVLGKLDADGPLADDLDKITAAPLLDEAMLERLVQAARGTTEVDAARTAISRLQASWIIQQKTEQWSWIAQEPRFVLVENKWSVEFPDDEDESEWFFLTLRQLSEATAPASPKTGTSPEFSAAVDMPENLGMHVRLPRANLTAQGRARLVDAGVVNAAVLGTTARFEDESLWITPIAVFARVEK